MEKLKILRNLILKIFILLLILSIPYIYIEFLSDKVVLVSGNCSNKTTKRDTSFNRSILSLKAVDSANNEIHLSNLKHEFICKLSSVNIRTLIFKFSNLNNLIPSTVRISKPLKNLSQERKENLLVHKSKYVEITGKCNDKYLSKDIYYLNNVILNDSIVYLLLLDSNDNLMKCKYKESLTLNTVKREHFVKYKIQNKLSLVDEEVIFSASNCVSKSKKYETLYRVKGKVLKENSLKVLISVPQAKANVSCLKVDIDEMSPFSPK